MTMDVRDPENACRAYRPRSACMAACIRVPGSRARLRESSPAPGSRVPSRSSGFVPVSIGLTPAFSHYLFILVRVSPNHIKVTLTRHNTCPHGLPRIAFPQVRALALPDCPLLGDVTESIRHLTCDSTKRSMQA
jgi:hypothetical protein